MVCWILEPPVIAAVISAIVAIVALLLNYYGTIRSLRQVTARDFVKTSLDFKIKQLNELYGPLLLLISQNKRLAQKLREGKPDPDNWRLLDHIPEVQGNPQDRAAAEEIIKNDEEIEKLLISKGGLVNPPEFPKSFEDFLGHYKLLKLAWNNRPWPHVKEFEYYPLQLNQDVEEGHKEIMGEVHKMLKKYESILKV